MKEKNEEGAVEQRQIAKRNFNLPVTSNTSRIWFDTVNSFGQTESVYYVIVEVVTSSFEYNCSAASLFL